MTLPTLDARVADLARRGALFALNDSGGKDSQAQRIVMVRRLRELGAERIIVVHASLGDIEWPGALDHARDGAARDGLPFIVATARKSFEAMVRHRAAHYPNAPAFPTPAQRQCTSDLKRDPIVRETRAYARSIGASLIVTCLGLRADESPRRRQRPTLTRSTRLSRGPWEWWEHLPVHGLTTPQVFDLIREAGELPHWAYFGGNARLSCLFCIMGAARDLRHAAVERPDVFERYVELERETGWTLQPRGRSLEDLAGLTVAQAWAEHHRRAQRRRLPLLAA